MKWAFWFFMWACLLLLPVGACAESWAEFTDRIQAMVKAEDTVRVEVSGTVDAPGEKDAAIQLAPGKRLEIVGGNFGGMLLGGGDIRLTGVQVQSDVPDGAAITLVAPGKKAAGIALTIDADSVVRSTGAGGVGLRADMDGGKMAQASLRLEGLIESEQGDAVDLVFATKQEMTISLSQQGQVRGAQGGLRLQVEGNGNPVTLEVENNGSITGEQGQGLCLEANVVKSPVYAQVQNGKEGTLQGGQEGLFLSLSGAPAGKKETDIGKGTLVNDGRITGGTYALGFAASAVEPVPMQVREAGELVYGDERLAVFAAFLQEAGGKLEPVGEVDFMFTALPWLDYFGCDFFPKGMRIGSCLRLAYQEEEEVRTEELYPLEQKGRGLTRPLDDTALEAMYRDPLVPITIDVVPNMGSEDFVDNVFYRRALPLKSGNNTTYSRIVEPVEQPDYETFERKEEVDRYIEAFLKDNEGFRIAEGTTYDENGNEVGGTDTYVSISLAKILHVDLTEDGKYANVLALMRMMEPDSKMILYLPMMTSFSGDYEDLARAFAEEDEAYFEEMMAYFRKEYGDEPRWLTKGSSYFNAIPNTDTLSIFNEYTMPLLTEAKEYIDPYVKDQPSAAYKDVVEDYFFGSGSRWGFFGREAAERLTADYQAPVRRDDATYMLFRTIYNINQNSFDVDGLYGEEEQVYTPSYTDTTDRYVEGAEKNGLLSEHGGAFRPEEPVTRREAAEILYNGIQRLCEEGILDINDFYDLQQQGYVQYSDISEEALRLIGMMRDADTGELIMGTDSGLFRPDDEITVEELMDIVSRMSRVLEGLRDLKWQRDMDAKNEELYLAGKIDENGFYINNGAEEPAEEQPVYAPQQSPVEDTRNAKPYYFADVELGGMVRAVRSSGEEEEIRFEAAPLREGVYLFYSDADGENTLSLQYESDTSVSGVPVRDGGPQVLYSIQYEELASSVSTETAYEEGTFVTWLKPGNYRETEGDAGMTVSWTTDLAKAPDRNAAPVYFIAGETFDLVMQNYCGLASDNAIDARHLADGESMSLHAELEGAFKRPYMIHIRRIGVLEEGMTYEELQSTVGEGYPVLIPLNGTQTAALPLLMQLTEETETPDGEEQQAEADEEAPPTEDATGIRLTEQAQTEGYVLHTFMQQPQGGYTLRDDRGGTLQIWPQQQMSLAAPALYRLQIRPLIENDPLFVQREEVYAGDATTVPIMRYLRAEAAQGTSLLLVAGDTFTYQAVNEAGEVALQHTFQAGELPLGEAVYVDVPSMAEGESARSIILTCLYRYDRAQVAAELAEQRRQVQEKAEKGIELPNQYYLVDPGAPFEEIVTISNEKYEEVDRRPYDGTALPVEGIHSVILEDGYQRHNLMAANGREAGLHERQLELPNLYVVEAELLHLDAYEVHQEMTDACEHLGWEEASLPQSTHLLLMSDSSYYSLYAGPLDFDPEQDGEWRTLNADARIDLTGLSVGDTIELPLETTEAGSDNQFKPVELEPAPILRLTIREQIR